MAKKISELEEMVAITGNDYVEVSKSDGVGGYTSKKWKPGTLKLDDLAAPDDNTDLNASATAHGLLPKLSDNAEQFLTGKGTWEIPSGSGNVLGPATNTDAYIPQWDGGNSKTLKNGLEVSTTIGSPGSDSKVPTEQAVREAITDLTVTGTFISGGVINTIGTPGQIGFGVGVCPSANLPSGMTPMTGYNDPASPNYGNYQYADGSIMVYIPKFYYRMHTWAINQITAATKANPCQITQVGHGYVTGDKIFITNVGGMTQLNNRFFTVTKVDDDNYTIGVDSSAYSTFTSLGDSTKGFGTTFDFNETLITYGKNSIQIKGADTYATEALANADGYALHRAFWDGNVEQPGFFVDKYKNSKVANGTGYTAASIKNGLPLSSFSAHNPFSDLTGGENYYYSAVDLAHRRDGVNGNVNASSRFHVKSAFQNSALAMLSLAHGQYSQTDTYCAWYNATYNYPKGCNSGTLRDSDDATVIYASDGYSNACRTGSGVAFNKTTHNGQASGVADLNGGMYEISIGVTAIATNLNISGISNANPCEITTAAAHGLSTGDYVQIGSIAAGTLATAINDKIWQVTVTGTTTFTIVLDSSGLSAWVSGGVVTKGTFYAAKKATAMKTFTSGASAATDHWGATGVAAMMDAFVPPFKSGYAFLMRYGSGTNQVLSESLSGSGWVLTGLGFPKTGSGVDATGTNLFGRDLFYQYIRNELCLLSSAYWSSDSAAGVWCAGWNNSRADSSSVVGFRLACYPD